MPSAWRLPNRSRQFSGRDISGTSLAFVCTAAGDVFVYLDTKTAAKQQVGTQLAKALFGSFGKWHLVLSSHSVTLVGSAGAYTLLVDKGHTVSLTTRPIKGGDGKGFVVLENVHGDPYDRLWQAISKQASFNDHGQTFSLQGSSAFYVDKLTVRKRLR